MTTRNWKDVARLARQHKFDRFKNANPPPVAEPSVEGPTERPTQEPKKQDDEFRARAKRHASMDFRAKSDDANEMKDPFAFNQSKRASWSATESKHSHFGPKKTESCMPPPPPATKPAEAEKAEEPAAAQPENPAARLKTQTKKIEEQENATRVSTPSKIRNEKVSTPLQERTNLSQDTTVSAKKPANCLKAKPFAKLLKENKVSFYEMLEIQECASEKDVLKSFRTWAKVVHPDHNHEITATEDFQALQHIYEILRTPRTRIAYNCRQKIRRYAFGSRPQTQAASN